MVGSGELNAGSHQKSRLRSRKVFFRTESLKYVSFCQKCIPIDFHTDFEAIIFARTRFSDFSASLNSKQARYMNQDFRKSDFECLARLDRVSGNFHVPLSKYNAFRVMISNFGLF